MPNPIEELKKSVEDMNATAVAKIEEISKKSDTSHEATQKAIDEINQKFADYQKEMDQKLIERSVTLPGVQDEKKVFNFQKAFAGIMTNDWDGANAGFEKEVFDNTKGLVQKAQTVSGTNGTGYWVPTEISSQFVAPALKSMPLFDKITVMSDVTGDFTLPVLLTRPEAGHVAESGVPGEINYTWGNRRFAPKRASGYTKIGNLAVIQTQGNLDSIIQEQLQKSLRLKIANAMINGKGTDNEPAGILNAGIVADFTSTTAIGTNGGRFTAQYASNMMADLEEADHDVGGEGNWAFLQRPIVTQGMKLERIAQYSGDTTGSYVFNPIITHQMIENMVGYPILHSTHLSKTVTKGTSSTCSNVILGDWKEMYMALWQGMKLRVSNQASDSAGNSAFLQDETWLIVDQYYDLNVGDRTRFTRIADAETNRANW